MSSVAPDGRRLPTRGAWLDTAPVAADPIPHAGQPVRASRRRNVSTMSLLFVFGIALLLVGLAIAMQATTYDWWGGLLVGVFLLLATVPLATRASKREHDPKTGRIILVAALAKLSIGSFTRYVVAYYLYKSADAESYFQAGTLLAPQFRQGDFSDLGGLIGTRFIEVVTGVVIAIINESRMGAFVVYSWIAFLGLYFFYQAFRLAFPEGDHRRYRILIFFWPSLIFWPSSIGKDAWMTFMLGMCALGVANLLIGKMRGFAWLGVGSLGCVMVRPHIALLIAGGFVVALILRRNRGTYSRMLARPLGTAVLIIGMMIASIVLFAQTEQFFKLDSLDVESAQAVLSSTSAQTDEGGASFSPPSPTSPIGFVEATVTVLTRPFPLEIPSAAGSVAGLEGLLLLGLLGVSFGRLSRLPRMMMRNPYVAFATAYTAAFVFAFSSISNFGILARERASQLFPVLFILLALPKRPVDGDETEDAAIDTDSVTVT